MLLMPVLLAPEKNMPEMDADADFRWREVEADSR